MQLPAAARYKPNDEYNHQYNYEDTHAHAGFENAAYDFAGAERDHKSEQCNPGVTERFHIFVYTATAKRLPYHF